METTPAGAHVPCNSARSDAASRTVGTVQPACQRVHCSLPVVMLLQEGFVDVLGWPRDAPPRHPPLQAVLHLRHTGPHQLQARGPWRRRPQPLCTAGRRGRRQAGAEAGWAEAGRASGWRKMSKGCSCSCAPTQCTAAPAQLKKPPWARASSAGGLTYGCRRRSAPPPCWRQTLL